MLLKKCLPYHTINKIYLSVAADILSDKEKELNYAELAFIAKLIPLSMSEIANLIKKNKSTISKWKEKRTSHTILALSLNKSYRK